MHLLTENEPGSFIDCGEQVISEADVNCIRWNPVNRKQFVSCGDDGMVSVWELSLLLVCWTNIELYKDERSIIIAWVLIHFIII